MAGETAKGTAAPDNFPVTTSDSSIVGSAIDGGSAIGQAILAERRIAVH